MNLKYCQICAFNFNSDQNYPMVMKNCGHTIFRQCAFSALEILKINQAWYVCKTKIQNSNFGNSQWQLRRSEILYYKKEDFFSKNYFLMDVIDSGAIKKNATTKISY